jgi:class 3 adenylate cyclase
MVERVRSDVSFPHGTVTLLFTDIEGSTRLLQELGDEYADVLADHRRRLGEAFARHGGVEVGTDGDAFFVALRRRPTRWRRRRRGAKRSPTDRSECAWVCTRASRP